MLNRPEDQYELLGFRLLKQDKELLKEEARKRRMNLTDLVRTIIFDHLEKN
jgi:hypothetical protein